MGKRKTPEQFNEQIKSRFNGEYVVISRYTGVSDPIQILHMTEHPHCFISKPDYMLQNVYPCHTCLNKRVSDRITKGQQKFIDEVYELAGNRYIVVGKYISAKDNIEIIHNTKEPHIINTTPDSFLRSIKHGGSGCHRCHMKYMHDSARLTQEQYIKKIKSIYGNSILVSGRYINNYSKIEMIHNTKEPHKFVTTPGQLINQHQGCSACRYKLSTLKNRLSLEEINYRLSNMYGDEFSMISNNLGVNVRATFRHNTDNSHEFITTPAAILSGNSTCTVCHLSNMELLTRQYLDNNHILYEQQKRFKDCKDKYMLPFDFYLPEYNTIVEDDGEQHHKVVDFFGGEEGYNTRVKHDTIKNKYCKKKGINLIRINYDEDIESVLSEYLYKQSQERIKYYKQEKFEVS